MKTRSITTIAATLLASAFTLAAAETPALWTRNCASCHGPDGKGQTRMGRTSGAKDYSDPKVQEALKEDKAFKSVKEGLTEEGKERMKPFADKLTDDEIKELIKHLRTFKKAP